MKNGEKYAEWIKNYKGDDLCGDFIKPKILKGDCCNGNSCMKCIMLQMLWFDEEYEEPEVDWTKVAVDTPILVRDVENRDWTRRYFAKFENGRVYAWTDGTTEWSAEKNDRITGWKYAKLAEQEDSDGKQVI